MWSNSYVEYFTSRVHVFLTYEESQLLQYWSTHIKIEAMFKSLAYKTCNNDSDLHLSVEQKLRKKYAIETNLSQVPFSYLFGWEKSLSIVVKQFHLFTSWNGA